MSGLDIAIELAKLLEPDETLRAEVATAEPTVYDLETLYVWLARESYVPEGDGSGDLHNFAIDVAWLTPVSELDGREAEASAILAEKAGDLARIVRHNRANTPYWEGLEVGAIDHEDGPVTLEGRGFQMTITGYIQDWS